MKKSYLPFLGAFTSLCLAITLLPDTLAAREFTNQKGVKINAEVVSVSDSKVTLLLNSNKKEYTFPLKTLSKSDQEYLKKWKEKKKTKKPEQAEDKKPVNSNSERTRAYLDYTYKKIVKKYDTKDNFDAKWPRLVSADIPDVKIVSEDAEAKRFVYHSDNYEFICDVKLSKNVVNKFAHLFEATRKYCQALPISLVKTNIPGSENRYRILLFETKQSYLQNGGPTGSAGVYMPTSDVIMVPLTSLGVIKSGSGYRYDYDGANNTLPHEITHQLTHRNYYNLGARGWFSEGLAEYVSMTDYRSGKFMVVGNVKDIKEASTGFSRKTNRGRNLGEEFTAPDLKKYMSMPYGEFTANGNYNYAIGALITCYFFHLEDDRTAINAFLKALNEGKKGEEALKELLQGRTYDELEKDIHKAWRSKGVKINFS